MVITVLTSCARRTNPEDQVELTSPPAGGRINLGEQYAHL